MVGMFRALCVAVDQGLPEMVWVRIRMFLNEGHASSHDVSGKRRTRYCVDVDKDAVVAVRIAPSFEPYAGNGTACSW